MPFLRMIGGKCGCVVCRDGILGTGQSRSWWQARKNKHGKPYGRVKRRGKSK